MTLGKLVSGLAAAGHKLQLVCTASEQRSLADIPHGVDYYPVKGIAIPNYSEARFGLPSKNFLKQLWGTERPDAIYVATEGPLGWSAINLARKLGVPSVSGFHTNFQSYSQHYGFGMPKWIVEKYLVRLHNKSAITLTPTHGQKEKLLAMGIKDVAVLSRGVDTTLFSPTKRSISLRLSWGVGDDHEPVLLYVGRIAAEKNMDLAIKTYHAMKKQNQALKFVLVGDGPLLNKLMKENPGFIFAGMKTGDELAKYYASSDIFVFPSITETFGNVVLEAMASGLAVIAYDYAAANMHIRYGITGMLAKFNNANEFILAACEYSSNNAFLEDIRMNASKYATKQSWSEVIQLFESVLMEQGFKAFHNYIATKNNVHSVIN